MRHTYTLEKCSKGRLVFYQCGSLSAKLNVKQQIAHTCLCKIVINFADLRDIV